MKKLILGIVLLFCAGCASSAYDINAVTDAVLAKTAKEIAKNYGVEITGSGGSCMGGVHELSFDCRVYRELSIPEAREILVKCVETFVKNINDDKDIRPLLAEYPFPAKRISFSLYVTDHTYDPIRKPGVLKSCKLLRGQIEYISVKEEGSYDHANQRDIMLQEPYKEAKRLVAKNDLVKKEKSR